MKQTTVSERALVLAPRGRDAAIAVAMLGEAAIEASAAGSLGEVLAGLEQGAAFLIVTEEAIATVDLNPLCTWLREQAEWSDLPVILLTSRGGGLERNPAAGRHLELLGNVTFLERPFHPTTLVSLARSALRARRRQYEARARLTELREGEQRYRMLFESMQDGFAVVEFLDGPEGPLSDYVHVQANEAYTTNAGIPEIVGKRLRQIVSPSEAEGWLAVYRDVLLTGRPVRFERELVETGRYLELSSFRVASADQRRVAVMFKDMTARRQAEKALRDLNETLERRVEEAVAERELAAAQLHEAQKLETLGQLTGGVAHDINNLLTPITGALDLLAHRYVGDDARAARLVGGALQSAERARVLVSRLLGFARRQALETRPVDIAALIEGLRDLILSSVGAAVKLDIAIAPQLPAALADPNQLELALLNLCVNARDAMPGGGTVTIAADGVSAGVPGAPELPPGPYLRIAVSDTGTGMDVATLARAIEPFYSTKEVGKGTGLGLSMVHGLAAQLGGAFLLTSAVGQGTRAELYLRATRAVAEPARAVRGNDAAALRPVALLLVDDEELVRTGTAEMLRDLGHTVHEVANGAEALARLSDGLEVDAMMTDYMMPGINGVELATRVRALRPALPVLVVTGYAGGNLDVGLPQLAKPFRREDLATALRAVVEPAPLPLA